jgi:hypothetical protein
MQQSHLLPDAADFLKLAYIVVVAALTAGMGFLAGARRLETAFFSGWGLASLIFVVAGTWLSIDLAWAAGLAGLLGVVGWVRLGARAVGGRIGGDHIGLRVLLIGMPFVLLVLGMSDVAWDDFSFWVPNLLHLCATHHFPTLAQPAAHSIMAAYPYGTALPGFAVHLLHGGDVDTVAIVWNVLAMLAACAAFTHVIVQRMRLAGEEPTASALWGFSALGVLLVGMGNPSFIAKIVLTNMGDSATGAGLAVLAALLFEWAEATEHHSPQVRILTELSLTCCAVVFIRQTNPALLGLLVLSVMAGLALFGVRISRNVFAKLAATQVLPLLIWYSWTHYAGIEIPGGSHHLLTWQAWHWSEFGSTLRSASRVLVEKSSYTAMALGMGVIVARMVWLRMRDGATSRGGWLRPASAVVATAVAGLAFGNIVFLLFCYLATSFSSDEAKTAITFWRFVSQTGLALTIGFACVVPIGWLTRWSRRLAVQRAILVMGLLVPIVAVSTYRDDLTSPTPVLRTMADDIHRAVPHDEPVVLLDLTGNGFAPLVVKYQMTAIDSDDRPVSMIASTHGISPAQARTLNLPSGSYVWLAEGSPAYGTLFGNSTNGGCSYLFSNESGMFRLIKDWDIGRYRWSTEQPAAQPGAERGCSG